MNIYMCDVMYVKLMYWILYMYIYICVYIYMSSIQVNIESKAAAAVVVPKRNQVVDSIVE